MSTEPETSPPAPFVEYTLTVDPLGVVTVLDPQGVPGYRVRLPGGEVQAFPAASGEPGEANAAADLAYALAHPPEPAPDPAATYAAILAQGYTDAETGLKLKTTEAAQRRFSDALNLIREAVDAGALTGATPFVIYDYDDMRHEIPVADLRALLLRYGFACAQLFDQYAP